MPPPLNPEIERVYIEYNRLLKAYQAAKEAYEFDNSSENWQVLQEALLALKRHNDKRDR